MASRTRSRVMALTLAATVSIGIGGCFDPHKPEPDRMSSTFQDQNREKSAHELLSKARTEEHANSAADKAIKSLSDMRLPAERVKALGDYMAFLAPPYKKVGEQRESVQSRAAIKIFSKYPGETLLASLSLADKINFGDENLLAAYVYSAYKAVELNPQFRETAEKMFLEALSADGKWGQKYVVALCASYLEMTSLSGPIGDAATKGLSLDSGVPSGVLRAINTAGYRLAILALEEHKRKHGGLILDKIPVREDD